MRAAHWVIAALAAASVHCGGDEGRQAPEDPAPIDGDQDGVVTAQDCNDRDPAVWRLATAHPDGDGDGRGAATATTVCAGDALPYGWTDDASDCDDSSGALWKMGEAYPDLDGDGVTVLAVGVVCSGDTLPRGYATDQNGLDCDDEDAAVFASMSAFVDADGDLRGGASGTVCAGYSLPAGWAAQGGDCDEADGRRWQLLSYSYVDRDRDGYTKYEYGTVCSGAGLASPYSSTPGWRGNGDCDDADALAYVTVYGYADTDTDGVGGGSIAALCTRGSLPAGYLATGGDCAPEDKTSWRPYSYTYRDADGDGRFAYQSGTVCYGTSVPAGYATSAASPLDCDDSDASVHTALWGYADADADLVGAGPATRYCTAGALPSDRVATGTDCDDADPRIWQKLAYAGLDEDGDGYTTRAGGTLCTGAALPDPYRAIAVGNDCDDADTALWRWTVVYPDVDGDGIGAPPREIPCLGATIPAGYSLQGWDTSPADPAVQASGADLLSVLGL